MSYKKMKVPFGKTVKKISKPVTPAQSRFAAGIGRVVKTFVKTKK